MGTTFSATYQAYTHPDVAPNKHTNPEFNGLYGFSDGRKEREMKVTLDEMEAAGLRADQRDYCAHHLIDFYKCREQNFPWVAACGDIKHHWDACQFDDFVLRMKEYEREKRLLERAKRKGELVGRPMVAAQ